MYMVMFKETTFSNFEIRFAGFKLISCTAA